MTSEGVVVDKDGNIFYGLDGGMYPTDFDFCIIIALIAVQLLVVYVIFRVIKRWWKGSDKNRDQVAEVEKYQKCLANKRNRTMTIELNRGNDNERSRHNGPLD